MYKFQTNSTHSVSFTDQINFIWQNILTVADFSTSSCSYFLKLVPDVTARSKMIFIIILLQYLLYFTMYW